MTAELADRPEVSLDFLGAGSRRTRAARDALAERLVKRRHGVGFARSLREGVVPLGWHDACVGVVLIRIERRWLPVSRGPVCPSLLGTVATAIADVQGHDLARYPIHRQPQPRLIRLPLDDAAHLVRFRCHTPPEHLAGTVWQLPLSGLGNGRTTGGHAVHAPAEADTNGPVDAVQGDVLSEEACH